MHETRAEWFYRSEKLVNDKIDLRQFGISTILPDVSSSSAYQFWISDIQRDLYDCRWFGDRKSVTNEMRLVDHTTFGFWICADTPKHVPTSMIRSSSQT